MTHQPGRRAGRPRSVTTTIPPPSRSSLRSSPWPNVAGAYAINYAKQIRETSPGSILQRKSVVGIYFGWESCPHCGPFLRSLVALLRRCSEATIVFVSSGALEADTMGYFYMMPRWTAMPHGAAAGTLGKALVARFGVTTCRPSSSSIAPARSFPPMLATT